MFTVEEVAEQLNVSKVTIYSKLKKFDDRVILKQGKKYITDELFNLIKNDLKIKNFNNNNLNIDNDINGLNAEIATDRDDLINLNKDLINTLIKQLEEKDKQIADLHRLIENNQVLLKQEKEVNQLQLEEHLKEVDLKLNDVKDKMEQRKEEHKKGLFKKFFKFPK
ncbi:hypothetical protein FC764_16775 [Clostridium botulinum]|nr:hypothetical protein [Clostridium botulinum]